MRVCQFRVSTWLSRWASASALLALVGCATSGPYMRAELAHDSRKRPARAVVRYLAQANADPSVCRPGREQAIAWVDANVVESVAEALEDGDVAAQAAARCLTLMLASLPPTQQGEAFDAVAEVYADVLHESPPASERARVLHELVVRSELAAHHPRTLQRLAEQLAADADELAPPARALASEVALAEEARAGRFHGQPATLERLVTISRERDLELLATWLPSASLRLETRREIVQRRAAASPFAEVRADARAIAARVLETGRNAVRLDEHPLRSLRVELGAGESTIVVRQNAGELALDETQQVAMLLARLGNAVELAPTIPLQGRLWLESGALSFPVTVCDPTASYDPTPCIAPSDVVVEGSPITARDGQLILRERVPLAATLDWLGSGDRAALSVGLRVGTVAVALELPLHFERPKLRIYTAHEFTRGPDLAAKLEERGGQLILRVSHAEHTELTVLARDEATSVQVIARGAAGQRGRDGARGRSGSTGSTGMAATCSSSAGHGGRGGDGERGEDGGPGGPGGDGGDITVDVLCEPARCDALAALVPVLFRSEGGEGGSGGSGGAGGSGGSGGPGGSGTTCSEKGSFRSVPSGTSGWSGSSGSSGWQGSSGQRGAPGELEVVVHRGLR